MAAAASPVTSSRLGAAAAIVLAGVLARVALLTLSGGVHPQPLEYSAVAEQLHAGQGFVFEQYGTPYRAWKEPLFIGVLALIRRLPMRTDWLLVGLQSLLGIGAALGVARLTERLLGGAQRGTIAGVLAAVNPFLVYYDTRFIHPLSLDSALFVAVVAGHLSAINRCFEGMLGRTIQAGVITGLALWERATLTVASLAMWLAALVLAPRNRRPVIVPAIILWMGLAALVIAPWLWRNYQLFHRVVLTTDSAHVLWLGNNPWSNGTYSDLTGRRVIHLADAAFQRSIQGAPELVQQERFLAATHAFVREHPDRFARLCATRLLAFVWFSPNAGIEYAPMLQRLYRIGYTLLLLLGLFGFGLWWRRADEERRRNGLLILAAVAGLALTHTLVAINLKHRVPFELVLSIFAAESIAACSAGKGVRPTHRWRCRR